MKSLNLIGKTTIYIKYDGLNSLFVFYSPGNYQMSVRHNPLIQNWPYYINVDHRHKVSVYQWNYLKPINLWTIHLAPVALWGLTLFANFVKYTVCIRILIPSLYNSFNLCDYLGTVNKWLLSCLIDFVL